MYYCKPITDRHNSIHFITGLNHLHKIRFGKKKSKVRFGFGKNAWFGRLLIKIQSTLQLRFLDLRVIYEVYGLFNSWKPFVFYRGQFLVIATISKKCPYFATSFCFHGNPGNNLKKFLAFHWLGQTF